MPSEDKKRSVAMVTYKGAALLDLVAAHTVLDRGTGYRTVCVGERAEPLGYDTPVSGHREAALAYLTLLLVGVSRLAAEVEDDLCLNDEPLLAEVFGFVEERYGEPVSLKDVAMAVSLSPGYLTTVVRRKTGRTVVEWIAERRMAQGRRLLVETDLAVEEVGHRVGYHDPGYFVRTFRRAHGTTPLGWRRAGRS